MTWSIAVARRVLVGWPRRRPRPQPRKQRQSGPYRDAFFADPNVVEDDYLRLRRR